MLTEKRHVLFLSNEELDVLVAKMMKNKNSIFHQIRRRQNVRDLANVLFHAFNDRVRVCYDLSDEFVSQAFNNVLVVMFNHHVQIDRSDVCHFRYLLLFFFLIRMIRRENEQNEDDFDEILMHDVYFFEHAL